MGYLTHVESGFDWVKPHMIRMVFLILGRAAQSASKHDKDIQKDISEFHEGFKIMFKILPFGPCVVLEKQSDHLKFVGFKEQEADLTVFIKNVESGFLMFSAQMGTPRAFCEHRTLLKGNISDGIRFIRAMSNIQCYLFPKIIAQNVVPEVPQLTGERLALRLWIYTVGLVFGI